MIENAIYSLRNIDDYQKSGSRLHSAEPTFKLLLLVFFALSVVSCNKYDILSVVYLASFPVFLFFISGIPFIFFLRKILFLSPLVILSGIFNPFFDKAPIFVAGDFYISAGVMSFIVIIAKYVVIVFTLLIYISTTKFESIVWSFQKLKIPSVFITQFVIFYKYIFVIGEEAVKMIIAYRLRSGSDREFNLKVFTCVISQLFIRAYERAGRVYQCMLMRGFSGDINLIEERRFSKKEFVYLCCFALFMTVRFLVV